MSGFQTPMAGGITKLSQLTIDADKVWAGMGISNVKELALGMVQGDVLVHGGTKIIRLPAGIANMVLTSGGVGVVPSWQPGGTYFSRYFPATISQSKALAIIAAAQSIAKPGPFASAHVQAYDDSPASMVKRVTPVLASTKSVTIKAAADKSASKNGPVTRKYDLEIVVGGAVADDGGVLANETAAAQNATANDMTLLPAVPAVGDAYDFGFDKMFDVMKLNLGIQGAGVWTITWKYWNGAAWANLAGVTDDTTGFTAAVGLREVSFTRPVADWALTIISGLNLYWIRAEVTAYTSIATQPKGTQAWVRITT